MLDMSRIAEEMLLDFTLEEILESNNLTEHEVLEMLLENGLIDYRSYENHEEENNDEYD